MIFGKHRSRRDRGPKFVEAGPGLFERLSASWTRGGGGLRRCLAVAAWVVAVPIVVFRRIAETFAAAFVAAVAGARLFRARRFRHLLQGLPAVVVACGVGGVAVAMAERAPSLTRTYRRLGAEALREDRPEEARLYFERLYRLDGGEAETRFFLGLALEELGRKDEAAVLIRGVAEGDGGGYARANAWVASRLLAEKVSFSDPERLRELRRHLEAAEDGLPRDPAVKLGLVRFFLATGQSHRAIDKLSAAAAIDPALNYDLARLHTAAGQADAARAAMERAEAHARKALDASPDDRKSRLLLANCLLLLGRPEEAVAVLREGMATDPEGPYGAAAARVHLAIYDRVASQPNRDHRAMLGLLREALRYDPRSPDAAVRLASFGEGAGASALMDSAGDPQAAAEATRLLEELLATGEQPPAVHMALGLKAFRRGENEDAEWHFERAHDLDPSLAGVVNNLAWILCHRPQPDLARALALADKALELRPDDHHFRDTRGEIYRRMGRWEEALRDFEYALPVLRDDARLHRSLAEVYDQMGKSGIATKHREKAEELEAGAGDGRPRDGTASPS